MRKKREIALLACVPKPRGRQGGGQRKSYVEPQIPLVCLTHPGLELKTPAVSTNLPLWPPAAPDSSTVSQIKREMGLLLLNPNSTRSKKVCVLTSYALRHAPEPDTPGMPCSESHLTFQKRGQSTEKSVSARNSSQFPSLILSK